jgi:hypothetical protein
VSGPFPTCADDAGRGEGRLQAGRVALRLLHQEHARRPDDLDQRLANVVLGIRVLDRVDRDPHGVEAGGGGLDDVRERGLSGRQADLRGVEQRAVEVPPHGGGGRGVADDHGLRVRLLTLVDRAGRVEPVDARLGSERHVQGKDIHTHAFGVQQARLGDRVAEVGAPVADDDDVAPSVGRQDRTRQLQGGRQVRVVGVGPALEVGELGIRAHAHLYLRVAAEADDARAVAAASLGQDSLHRGRLFVLGALRARGKVRQHDQRLLVRRRLQGEPSQRGGEEQDDHDAEAERRARPRRIEGRRQPPPDQDDEHGRDDAGSQEERARQLKAHAQNPR